MVSTLYYAILLWKVCNNIRRWVWRVLNELESQSQAIPNSICNCIARWKWSFIAVNSLKVSCFIPRLNTQQNHELHPSWRLLPLSRVLPRSSERLQSWSISRALRLWQHHNSKRAATRFPPVWHPAQAFIVALWSLEWGNHLVDRSRLLVL